MHSDEVFYITKKISLSAKTEVGVHIHNNMGQANQISCEAIDKGFFADSTLLGKGRMGGNADTILLVLYRALMNTNDINTINNYINKFLECTSMIWGREARGPLRRGGARPAGEALDAVALRAPDAEGVLRDR